LTFTRAAGALVVALALALALAPGALGLAQEQGPVAALILLAIGFWATGALPFHLTALALLLIATVLELAPPRVIFAGFASSALWLIFGGLVIGNAVQATGLGRRLARLLMGLLGGSYRRIVYGTVALGVVLAFLVPAAMGRIMILVPIFVALTGELGLGRSDPARTGILLAAGLGTILPAFAILPANLPNMVLLGVAETLYGVSPSYGSWLLLHFPVLGLLQALLLAELICRLFPGTIAARNAARAEPLPAWSRAEIRLLAVMVLALAFWATDSLHGVSPGWVALAAALACMLPGVGVLDARAFESATSFGTFFYVAGVLGMVSLFDASGLAGVIGGHAIDWLPLAPDAPAANFAALVGAVWLIGLFTTHPGVAAVLGPLAPQLAAAGNLPLDTVLMIPVVGFAALLLPYQSAPVLVALQLAGVRLASGSKLTMILSATTLLVLVPLDFFWWRWLGYL
jgi:anion transporter